jgi:hypothetical protein
MLVTCPGSHQWHLQVPVHEAPHLASESALDLQAVPPGANETIIALAHSINESAYLSGEVPPDQEVVAELQEILHAPHFAVSSCRNSRPLPKP